MHCRLPLIVLALSFMYACTDASVPPQAAGRPAAAAAAEGPPRYDAELIYADFTASDPQVLEKYRRTPFLVTGRLQKIHAAGVSELQLDLKAADPAHPVRVRLKSDPACDDTRRCPDQIALNTLPRGFKVYLECGRADVEDGTPTVAECVLTQAPGRAS